MPSATDSARDDFEPACICLVLGHSHERLQDFVASSEYLDQKGGIRQNKCYLNLGVVRRKTILIFLTFARIHSFCKTSMSLEGRTQPFPPKERFQVAINSKCIMKLNNDCREPGITYNRTDGTLLFSVFKGNPELPTAVNITWSSINFKTILQWQPKPSGYFYTVEIHGQTSDTKKKCIMIAETECDVTDVLRNIKETYTAHILSVTASGMDNFEEPPFAVSEKFTPYYQTVLGKPEIQNYTQKDSKLNIVFQDPLTPYTFPNGTFQSIRDIFQNDLEYKLYYWKDQSSGKKDATTKSQKFEVSVENTKNYCFYIQGIIPSRREKRYGQESMVLCTSIGRNILDEYGAEVFIIIAVIAIAVITLVVVLSVILCKRKKAKAAREKEPRNGV